MRRQLHLNLFIHSRGRQDDLLLAAALASWYLADSGRPSQGIFEYYRELAGARPGGGEWFAVGVDLGQSNDPTAICVMSRAELPGAGDETFAAAPAEAGSSP